MIPRFPKTLAHILDGTSNTILLGEKYVNPIFYAGSNLNSCSDNNPAYNGYDWDNIRWVPKNNNDHGKIPKRDSLDVDPGCSKRFGSSHSAIFYTAMCDGSVQGIGYDVDLKVLRAKGTRNGKELVQ